MTMVILSIKVVNLKMTLIEDKFINENIPLDWTGYVRILVLIFSSCGYRKVIGMLPNSNLYGLSEL